MYLVKHYYVDWYYCTSHTVTHCWGFDNVTASSLKMKSNSNAFGTAVYMSGRQGAVLALRNLSQMTFLMRLIQMLF